MLIRLVRKIIKFLKPVDLSRPQIMKGTLVDKHSTIGSYTYIGYNCLVTKSQIGNYCSIANNSSVGPGEHDLTKVSTNSIFYENAYEELTKRDVVIGHDVWIAANVVIRRGVKIGNGAVIGANSFVNTDIPDFSIYAGSPAKLIKYRFNEEKRIKISESKWWLKDLTEAKKIISQLEISEGFV